MTNLSRRQRHPPRVSRAAAAFGLSPLGAKKIEIAAAHEFYTVADEADDLAAQAIVAPSRAARNMVAEQDLRDCTVIGAVQGSVQGAQGEPKAAAAISREGRWRAAAAYQQSMKPSRRVDPILEQVVEREHEGDRPRCRLSQQERSPLRRQSAQVEVAAFS